MQNAMIISQLPLDVVGGGELFTINAFRQLQRLVPDAELWYSQAPQPEIAPHCQRIRQTYIRGSLDGERVVPAEQLPLTDLLFRAAQYDFFAIHQYLSCSSTMDWIAALAPDQNLVLTSLGHEAFGQHFTRVFEPAENICIAEISEFAAERSRARGIEAVGICAGVFEHDLCEPLLKEWNNTPTAVAVGRILPHKGFDVTVRAMPENWNLNIVGPPSGDVSFERYLGGLIKSKANVRMMGFVSRTDRDQIISTSQALVASSCTTLFDGKEIEQAELFGLVLLEAVAAGVIPVASDIPSFREVMGQLGLRRWLYPQRDANNLGQVLRELASLRPNEYLQEVRAAQTRVRENYLWDNYWLKIFGALKLERPTASSQRVAA